MKSIKLASMALLLVGLMGFAQLPDSTAALAGHELPKMKVTAFAPGERLSYRIKWGWFTAGEASFEVDANMPKENGRECYHFRGAGRTLSIFSIYTVRDEFDTWVDAEALHPYRYLRKVHEGNTRFTDEVRFDHPAGIIRGGKGEFKTADRTHDIMSILYYTRCLDLRNAEEGKFYQLYTFLDDKIYPLGFTVVGRENVKVASGTYRCLKIKPRVVASTVFKDEEGMTIWVTDDENYIPVRVESPIIVGSIYADLVRADGVRNPQTAKIK